LINKCGRGNNYDIKLWLVWHGKVLAQVVESTLIVWEELGSSPMYANFCVIVLLFKYVKSCSGMIWCLDYDC